MAWTRSACPGALSLLDDKASGASRTMLKRCAVRRLAEGRRRADAAKPILLPTQPIVLEPVEAVAAQWPDTPMARRCHDLRTPLNAVIGFTDLMRQEPYGPLGDRRYAEYLDHIAASAQALLKSTEDTLALASTLTRPRA